jgi:hypothetical protein
MDRRALPVLCRHQGRLQPAYFGLTKLPADDVCVSETADTPFSSITVLDQYADGSRLYKVRM